MSKSKFQKTAIHSGIGDGHDLLVKPPEKEEAEETFKISARAKGKKENRAKVYPEVDFQYGIHYKGKTMETYHEEPYEFDIPAYPKRILEYDIEERRFLCYDRFWEIQADFEATVMRMTMNYAFEYKAVEEVSSELRFKLCWGGKFEDDPMKMFENNETNFVGKYNSNAYVFSDGVLRDDLNRDEFSGVLANPNVLPYDTKELEISLEFRPLPFIEKGTPIGRSEVLRYHRFYLDIIGRNHLSEMSVEDFQFTGKNPHAGQYGHRDDDVVGFFIRAKKGSNGVTGYLYLWEAEHRILRGRRVGPLERFNIASDSIMTGTSGTASDGTYSHTDANTKYVGNGGIVDNVNDLNPREIVNAEYYRRFSKEKGWGKVHQRIYKVVDNIITEEVDVDSYDKPGWEFNKWHKVRIVINKLGRIEIYVTINGGNEALAYAFDSEFDSGTIGLCNMSQAVEYRNLEFQQKGSGGGCVPEDGFETVSEDGQFHANAAEYIKKSIEKYASENGIKPSEVEVESLTVQYDGDPKGGRVDIPTSPPFNGPITVTCGKRLEERTGRVPETGWLSWDGIGDLEVAPNAMEYIKENASPPGEQSWDSGKYQITEINGIVQEDSSAAYDLQWSPKAKNITGWFDNSLSPDGPIIAHSNNPSDADAVYNATYYKCGFAEICPDHLSKETGVIVVSDCNILFAAEIAQFFNRNTYINEKRVYTLLYPVWEEQVPELIEPGKPPVVSLGGCVQEEGKDPVYGDLIACRPKIDDFFWDGNQLIMWTCDPPVEYKLISYAYGVYAFEGEVYRLHSEDFEPPNPWTTYRLIPIVETIEEKYDYVKWAGTDLLEWIPPYTAVVLCTRRYFIPNWSGEWEGLNKGIITSEEDAIFDIPPIPEQYLDPDTNTTMPHGYSGFIFLLESKPGFNKDTKLKLWWLSDPSHTTKNVDMSPENINQLNGTYMLKALNMADKVVVHCDKNPILTEWISGKYMGYGKLNGQGTLQCDYSGKADMMNVSTDVIYFPDNFVESSLEGPFVDVYVDQEKYKNAVIVWKLSEDKKFIQFSTDYMDVNKWYTNWASHWVQYDKSFMIKNDGVVSLGKLGDFTMIIDNDELEDVDIEKLEVTNNNPFVVAWSNDLTKEQLKELAGNIDTIDIMAIKDSWVQFDTVPDHDWGKGDWHFVTHDSKEMITNKRNQSGRSMWYNKSHRNQKDYGFRLNVKVEDTTDDDTVGVVFRFNPTTKEHYAVEWDSGGTTADGIRLVRYGRNSSDDPIILAREAGFYWGQAQKLEHSIMVKVKENNIRVYIDNVLKFNVNDDASDYLKKGAWGPMTISQPDTFFWNIQMFDLTESPEIFAKIKDTRPHDWSPMIHNGYYYLEDKEHYLYAEKIVHKVTPNSNHEIIISPRPEQGSAIIVQDNFGRNLRKVMFYDEQYEPTLKNTEVFNGNGNAAYYLNYKGIDKTTLLATVNGKSEEYIFDDTKSRIEFMRKLTSEDIVKVQYRVLYSYIIDMNYDVPGNRAKITLHNNYNISDMTNMTVTYESASETPFYRANEIVYNPLLNHNHEGFLYITDSSQTVKELTINISPKTLEVNEGRKVLITAKALDEFGNPAVGKKINLFRNGNDQTSTASSPVTNSAGEVYFYFTPIENKSDIPSSYVDEYKVTCEEKSAIGILNYYKQNNMDRRYIDIELSKEAIIGGTPDYVSVTITLRDTLFKRLKSKSVTVEITNTDGTKTEKKYTIKSTKEINMNISGAGQKQGYVYIKATHDMGKEDMVTLKAIKVLGG